MTGTNAKIIYDGDCPFCSSYVRYLRLRENLGRVELINARERKEIVKELSQRHIDLDEGMVLVLNGQYYHGAECIHRLALLSTRYTTFNKLNKLLFERRRVASILYPLLKAGRNLTLKLLGVKAIGNPE